MKYNNITLAVIAASSLFAASCSKVDDFLNEDPSKATARPVETVEQLDAVLASYAFYPVNYFEEMPDMLYASDDFRIDPTVQLVKNRGYNNFVLNYGLWNSENTVGDRYSTWNSEYKKVYYANLCLDNVDKVSGSEEAKAVVRADAHFMRAYSFFQIALAHTLYYDGKNGDELGISLKSSINFEEPIKRSSLAETWDFIDKDLQEALKCTKPFVTSEQPVRNWRASTVGVRSFAARYYLYRNDMANAKKYAQMVLEEYSEMKNLNNPKDMAFGSSSSWKYFLQDNGKLDSVLVRYPNTRQQLVTYFEMEPNMNALLGWKGLTYAKAIMEPTSATLLSEDLINTYKTDVPGGVLTNDLRYNFFVIQGYGLTVSTEGSASRNQPVSKKSLYPSYVNFLGDLLSGTTTAEMYLILAECAAREGLAQKAMEYVNIVRKNRIASAAYTDLTATDAADALKKVLQERRREMPFSIRWYDMKRLNAYDPANSVTVTRKFYPYTSTSVNINDELITYTLEPCSRHYAIPISSTEIANSKNIIEQNIYE